ncbi:hypothetical protein [Deinococcus sp.]|uniref:hypothetical protein n=1 Tax=Deinococcus sp. TaxID=47478 RepID=UPI0025EB73A2|nr:hypothetical protein [Deinococcus sp.]
MSKLPFTALRPSVLRQSVMGLLLLGTLNAGSASAWVPKLEDQSAKTIIDSAYGRRAAAPTYLTLDLSVAAGKFKGAPDGSVKVIDGGDACLTGWLTAPGDYAQGSKISNLTLSGQADQLLFQAQDARDNFKNLTVKEALLPAPGRLPDGQLRIDMVVRGLSDLQQRSAYLVRLKGADGKLLAPTRFSFVNDFKPGDGGKQTGTLVYYFEPLKAGLNANSKLDLLVRNEEGSCAYNFNLDLGKFN